MLGAGAPVSGKGQFDVLFIFPPVDKYIKKITLYKRTGTIEKERIVLDRFH